MPLDGKFLDLLVKELKQIENMHIDKIHCPLGGEFVFLLRGQKLLVSLHGTPYITLTKDTFNNPAYPPMFCMLLRKYLVGGKILKIEKIKNDRIVKITVSSVNELKDKSILEVYIELITGKANLVLTKDGKIIDCYKRSDLESERILAAGATYKLPIGVKSEISPLVKREMEYQNKTLDELAENIKPTILKTTNGEYKDFSFIEINQYENFYTKISFNSFIELINEFFTKKRKDFELKNAKNSLVKKVSGLLTKAERKLKLRQEDLKRTEKRETFRIYGELIKANLYNIKNGAKSAVLENYYNNLEKIEIPLKEELTPAKNAERYFKEYKKLCVAAGLLDDLISNNKNEIYYLKTVEESLKNITDVKDLDIIEKELIIAGYLRKAKEKSKKIKESPINIKEYMGFKIAIGKNNLENEKITLKLAGAKDMWFHAKNVPGSHVVVFLEGKEITDEVILYAAKVAAKNSTARLSSNVAVDYTEVKNIKKPKDSKPGMVIYKTNKTVYVTP